MTRTWKQTWTVETTPKRAGVEPRTFTVEADTYDEAYALADAGCDFAVEFWSSLDAVEFWHSLDEDPESAPTVLDCLQLERDLYRRTRDVFVAAGFATEEQGRDMYQKTAREAFAVYRDGLGFSDGVALMSQMSAWRHATGKMEERLFAARQQ